MDIFSALTISVGVITIIVNILIAKYNVGKNRKIYEIITLDSDSPDKINQQLKSADYTILYVSSKHDRNNRTYVLGKLNCRK